MSGATLKRPSLAGMLAAIESGLVDVVVVYKIDRLSRSLADFSSLMQLFDRHGVGLVSVTQHLNSLDAAGRLGINTLMAFAQFERENAAERTRDKLPATRRQGLWAGGVPPMGCKVVDQRLQVLPDEAEVVRRIFERFVALGSITEFESPRGLTEVSLRSHCTLTGCDCSHCRTCGINIMATLTWRISPAHS